MKKLLVAVAAIGISFGTVQAQEEPDTNLIEFEVNGTKIILDKADIESLKEGGKKIEELLDKIIAEAEESDMDGNINMTFKFNDDTIYFSGFEGEMKEWAADMKEWKADMEEWEKEMEALDFDVKERTDSLGNKKMVITRDGVEYEYPAEPNENWFEFNWEVPEAPEAPEAPESPEPPEPEKRGFLGELRDYEQNFGYRNDDDEDDDDMSGRFGETFGTVQFRLGFTNYLKGSNELPASGDDNYALNTWRSNIFTVGPAYKTRLAGPLFIKYGLEISFSDYFLKGDHELNQNGSATTYDPVGAEVKDLEKSKLNTTFLNAPVMLMLVSGDPEDEDGFTLGVGGYVGYLLGANTKLEYEDQSGDCIDTKRRGDFNLNEFEYGFQAQLGVKGFNLFARYAASQFFNTSASAPGLNGISFGVVF